MNGPVIQEAHRYSVYSAPRGKNRLLNFGIQLAQRHLYPADRLIGIVGDVGSGKSALIRGMFPGLELSNDDSGVNQRLIPLLSADEGNFFACHTCHLDVRFESAFIQIPALASAVLGAIETGRRVVVEHFDLLYPYMNINAELLIGIGEEVFVTRPGVFGVDPVRLAGRVKASMPYLRMAHTAQDLVQRALLCEGCAVYAQGDVPAGFALKFDALPDLSLERIERAVLAAIKENMPVSFLDEGSVLLGDERYPCSAPRLHVPSAGMIENFSLSKHFVYDPMDRKYLLTGFVGYGPARGGDPGAPEPWGSAPLNGVNG